MLLTGDFYTAQEACDWGEVDEVVPLEKLEETAMEMALKIANYDRDAVRITKKALWDVRGMTPEEAHLYSWDLLARHATSEKGREFMRKFREAVEKRTGLKYFTGEACSTEKGPGKKTE